MGSEASLVGVCCMTLSVGIGGLVVSWTGLGSLSVVLEPRGPGEGAAGVRGPTLAWEGGSGGTVKAAPLSLFLLLRLIFSTSMGEKTTKTRKTHKRIHRFFKCHCSSLCWSRGEGLVVFKMSDPPRRPRGFSLALALTQTVRFPTAHQLSTVRSLLREVLLPVGALRRQRLTLS